MIMAGGKGERLMPLTEHRSKPAVPFGGHYRIVDFVLSNFLNSGILALYVLVQYRSQSLIEHLRQAWRVGGRLTRNFITVVPPQMKARGGWYEGTADAVYQNLNLIRDFDPDLVAVFGADHIYRMDVSQMVRFHVEQQADVTVAALPVALDAARGFGIIEVSPEPGPAQRIVGFDEKPSHPKPMPTNQDYAYSSMGNYLFRTETLLHALERDAGHSGSHDFGRDIIPPLIRSSNIFAYNFLHNDVPGLKPYEERGYWRDVGTLDAYWQAHMDILGESPIFDLRNRDWPVLTDAYDAPNASFVRSHLDQAMVGEGSQIVESEIRRSVIGRNVRIGPGCHIEDSIIMEGTTVEAKTRLRRVIADRFNVIPAGTELGFHAAARKQFHVTRSGLVVLPRGRSGRRPVAATTGIMSQG
jgi:glucose-1-phosphate adenylyltransferase